MAQYRVFSLSSGKRIGRCLRHKGARVSCVGARSLSIIPSHFPVRRFYVEFGFNSMEFNGGSGANTYQLYRRGWQGILFDGDNENPAIRLYAHRLTPDNIVGLFLRYGVPRELDYLSVDVDSTDIWILRALFSGGFRPRALSIEYNSNFHPDSCIVPRRGAPLIYPTTKLYGASLGSLEMLGSEFGYGLVDVVAGLDAFMVRCDLLSSSRGGGPFAPIRASTYSWPHTCLSQHLLPPQENRHDFADYCVWAKSGGNDTSAEMSAYKQLQATHNAQNLKNADLLSCVSFGFE